MTSASRQGPPHTFVPQPRAAFNYTSVRPHLPNVSASDGDCLSYLDMLERSSAEEKRRQRERVMMEEGKKLWAAKKNEELEREIKEQEKVRELSQLRLFGRPGHGAPTENVRKKKFTEYQISEIAKRLGDQNANLPWSDSPTFESVGNNSRNSFNSDQKVGIGHGQKAQHGHQRPHRDESLDLEMQHDALTFGRPGYGAPVRTRSGRLRTEVRGNPEIRFQENPSVQKTIFNNIRYQSNPELKAQYHRELEQQIRLKKEIERLERERELNIAKELAQLEGSQWGRPGPGGRYWRGSTVTGQNFFDNLGWSGSADPRKRQFDVRHSEVEDMKKEMDEVKQRKDQEHADIKSSVGVELVPLLKEKPTGKPKKDPSTGYLMNHALASTDVTKIADAKRSEIPYASQNPEVRKQYSDTLNYQIQNRETQEQQRRRLEEEEQRRHFDSWGTFWGRPGYGAPRGTNHKENLMKLLHYPEKAPNHVELITLERLPVK